MSSLIYYLLIYSCSIMTVWLLLVVSLKKWQYHNSYQGPGMFSFFTYWADLIQLHGPRTLQVDIVRHPIPPIRCPLWSNKEPRLSCWFKQLYFNDLHNFTYSFLSCLSYSISFLIIPIKAYILTFQLGCRAPVNNFNLESNLLCGVSIKTVIWN